MGRDARIVTIKTKRPDCMPSASVPEIDPIKAKRPLESSALTREPVEFYDTEGYLVLPNLLTDSDMLQAQLAMQEKVEEMAQELLRSGLIKDTFSEEPFKTRLAKLFEGLSDEDFLKCGRSWRDRRSGYYHLMSNSKILDVIGAEIFSNPVYNVRPKVPKVAAGAVPWHQDKSYWPDANSNPVITVWIPLVDATHENGCLHIWPRTHKKQVLSTHAETYTGTGFIEIDEEHMKDLRVVPIPLAAGGAILFNDRCIHMSTPNNSDHVRWSVDLRYQPTDQDPMPQHGAGFLARSRERPERLADLEDWLNDRPEHIV